MAWRTGFRNGAPLAPARKAATSCKSIMPHGNGRTSQMERRGWIALNLAPRFLIGLVMGCMTFSILSCGGGGRGPTAPPAPVIPSVAGSWVGDWVFSPPISVSVRLDFVQDSAGHLTGNFTSLGSVIPITGTVTSALTLTWQGVGNDSGCAKLTGDGRVNGTSPTSITGTIDLDSRTCASGTDFSGNIVYTRTATSGAALQGGHRGTPGEYSSLLARMARPR